MTRGSTRPSTPAGETLDSDFWGTMGWLVDCIEELTTQVGILTRSGVQPPATGTTTPNPHNIQTVAAPTKTTKKKKATKPSPSSVLPQIPSFPLSGAFSKEGKPDTFLSTTVIPETLVPHVIGKGGQGLKQIHDISGASVRAFQVAGTAPDRHITIRGTDTQVGDALVVLGKRMARRRVRVPAKKRRTPAQAGSVPPPSALPPSARPSPTHTSPLPASAPPIKSRTGTAHPTPASGSTPSPMRVDPSTGGSLAPPTPSVPSVTMGSPSSPLTPGTSAGSPMAIDAARTPRKTTARRGDGYARRGGR